MRRGIAAFSQGEKSPVYQKFRGYIPQSTKSGDASPQSEIAMKLLLFLFAACLLASCASDQPDLPPPASDTAAYARTPHEFRDEMLSPKR